MYLRLSGSCQKLWLDFHDDVVLIELLVHGGDLALAERIIERVVDRRRADAQARRCVAVDDQRASRPRSCWSLLRSVNSGSVRNRAEDLRPPFIELSHVVALQGELVLRVAPAPAHAQILADLHGAIAPRTRVRACHAAGQ